jgi:alkylation response protein AidB-like acyl-CoA dehydrogenase
MIDFGQSPEQIEIVELARRFGQKHLEPAEIALDRIGNPEEVFTSELYRKTMAAAFDLGFHKMTIAEQYGGLGLDPTTVGPVWEELARHGAGFTASLLAGAVVPGLISFLAPDNERLVETYSKPFCADNTGAWLTAWCSSEPHLGSDGKNYNDLSVHHKARAAKVDGGWLLNGTKSAFVSNGGIARAYAVFACVYPEKGLRGTGMFIVDGSAPGLSRAPAEDRVGLRVLNQASVSLDNVFVPDDALIFPPGDAYPLLHTTIVTVGNLGTGYLAVGIMRAAYEEALKYARERVQWGKPIIEHQLVAKKLFDMHTAIEASRALLWKGSWHCARQFPGDLLTSVTAKVNATGLAVKHTAEMVQVLGGYGITRDYKLEKYMRDAMLLTIMDGTNDTLMMEAVSRL